MSQQSGSSRRSARFDVRAAAAAAVMYGILCGGGAGPQDAGKPTADGTSREAHPDAGSKADRDRDPRPAPVAPLPAAPPEAAPKPEPPTATPPTAPPAPASPPKAEDGATASPPDAPAVAPTGPLSGDDLRTLRAEAEAKLKELAPPADGSDSGDADPARKVADKALSEILEGRLRKLDDYDKLAAEMADKPRPESDPARRIAEGRSEIADVEARLKQPIAELIPPPFRDGAAVDQAAQDQMREIIAAAKKDVADNQARIEAAPAEPEKEAKAPLAALKADRDRIVQNLDAIRTRSEAHSEAPEPTAPADRLLAEERAVDLRIDAALESLRLQAAERKIERTTRAAEAASVDRARWIARIKLSRKMLEPMEARFRAIAEAQEQDLQRKAQTEQAKAGRESEPIRRYRAERLAELLDLEAAVVKAKRAATISEKPSLEDMTREAVVAASNFDRIKLIVEGDDQQAGRLDVMTINADYKRLQPERRRIEREERAAVEKRLTDYSNLLASVELNQIEDSLLDQIDLDDLLDRLPPGRHHEATLTWREMEDRHSELLKERRAALAALVQREADTLDQIDRRLAILEEESSFIRTHLFWLRDQDPIGATTAGLALGEARRLTRVGVGLARGSSSTSTWKRPTPEFLAAGALILVLPLGVFRARRALKRQLEEMLPPPPAPGSTATANPLVSQS